jgi:N-acyl homoserine lactone hydrolase
MTTSNTSLRRLYLIQVATSPSVPCYLLQTNDGRNILIDSGLPSQMPEGFQPPPNMPPIVLGKNVIEQLAGLGIKPTDINILIATHFDMDHVGNNDIFTNAEIVVQRAHYDYAHNGHPRFAISRPHWDSPFLRYRFVDGDTELVPGVELIETSGHTKGHQSVLIRLPHTGPVLLTVDSIVVASDFTPDHTPHHLDEDPAAVRASTIKQLDIVKREHVNLVIFGHDPEQWATLKKAPEYYD